MLNWFIYIATHASWGVRKTKLKPMIITVNIFNLHLELECYQS